MHLNFENLNKVTTSISVSEDIHNIEIMKITIQNLVRKVNDMRRKVLDLSKQGQISLQNMQTFFPLGI